MEEITKGLFALQDETYRKFHAKLMPEIEFERIIGVRTPALRRYAKEIAQEEYIEEFLEELPHRYYEENNLHGTLLTLRYRELNEFLEKLEIFLPYIDNWATCDLMSPKIFKKDLPRIYEEVKKWLKSSRTYTVRFQRSCRAASCRRCSGSSPTSGQRSIMSAWRWPGISASLW